MENNKNLSSNKEYIISELECRFFEEERMPDDLKSVIYEIEQCKDYNEFTNILNVLLINPNHKSHQYVAKLLQAIKSPTSISYIAQVLESNFSYLEYTCSKSNVIAKWLSSALASIGTIEAVDLIKKYAKSEDEGIRNEMLYRLSRINN